MAAIEYALQHSECRVLAIADDREEVTVFLTRTKH